MKLFLVCLALGISLVCQAEVPKLLTERPFTSASLAEAVNHYVELGESGTFRELETFLAGQAVETNRWSNRGYDVGERIAWLFRILYAPKPPVPVVVSKTGAVIQEKVVPLRPPAFGSLCLPEKTMPPEHWPLFPVALSGSTYFVLKERYIYVPSFQREDIRHYMAYCRDNGVFRKAPVPVTDREQAAGDAAALRQSAAWKAINWMDRGGFSFPTGEPRTFAGIQNQANAIPAGPAATNNPVSNPQSVSLR